MDVAAKDKRDFTTLHYAAAGSSLDVLERILRYPHSEWEKRNGWSTLHWAARTGDSRMLKVLSDIGIKERLVDTSEPPGRWTAVSIATFHQNKNFISKLSHDTEGLLSGRQGVKREQANLVYFATLQVRKKTVIPFAMVVFLSLFVKSIGAIDTSIS